MQHDHRRCGKLEGPLGDLPWIEGGMIDGAGLLDLIRDECVLTVQEEQPRLLDLMMRHGGMAVIEEFSPRANNRPFRELLPGHQNGGSLNAFDGRDGDFPHSGYALKLFGAGMHHGSETAKLLDQMFGCGLHIAAGLRKTQQEFQKFVIGKGAGAPL